MLSASISNVRDGRLASRTGNSTLSYPIPCHGLWKASIWTHRPARIRHNEDLFFLLCSSSFVESGSDLYTQNLVDHFAGDEELQTWLSQHWEHEELQHGRALAAYVRTVWPEFDWDTGFTAFWNDYGAVCTSEQLEADPRTGTGRTLRGGNRHRQPVSRAARHHRRAGAEAADQPHQER
jgi:uncharacterized membrane protein